MADASPVLIAGAGPTGLAAALFLKRLGVQSRIVDPKPEPSRTSNALGVNPRTLDLLEPTGVSAAILSEGLAIDRLAAHQNGKRIGEVALDPRADLGARFPMVILPQWRTEALLTQALAALGLTPERGLSLCAFTQDDDGVSYTLTDAGGETQPGRAAILFGADGAHSTIRKGLGLDFPGSAFPETWTVIDANIDVPEGPHGYVDFRKQGVFLALPYSATHWRLIGFGSDLLSTLPPGWGLKSVQWSSDFHISHRVAPALSHGRVCLAGDAAHIHAPVGARGMNLGIEDAFVFAHCAADFLKGGAHRLADYGRIRHETDAAVVRKVEAITRVARATGPLPRAIRPALLPLVTALPPLMHLVERMVTGLDHQVLLS